MTTRAAYVPTVRYSGATEWRFASMQHRSSLTPTGENVPPHAVSVRTGAQQSIEVQRFAEDKPMGDAVADVVHQDGEQSAVEQLEDELVRDRRSSRRDWRTWSSLK